MKHRHRWIAAALLVGAATYGAAYGAARRSRLLVHRCSYRDEGGVLVANDHRIQRGDPGIPISWSWPQHVIYFASYYVFWPALELETAYWYLARPRGPSLPRFPGTTR